MHIGIDLDNTIINPSPDYSDWNFIEGAVEYLRLLSSHGYHLHIITARNGSIGNREQVETIIQLLECNDIVITDVTYTFGTSKGRFARDLRCKYMIDDYPYYIEDCIENDVIPILFSDVYRESLYPRWKIAKTWREIYTFCLGNK